MQYIILPRPYDGSMTEGVYFSSITIFSSLSNLMYSSVSLISFDGILSTIDLFFSISVAYASNWSLSRLSTNSLIGFESFLKFLPIFCFSTTALTTYTLIGVLSCLAATSSTLVLAACLLRSKHDRSLCPQTSIQP